MIKKIIIFNVLLFSLLAHSQAKKPTLMIKPDDNWCEEKGFMIDIPNEGKIIRCPDYETALVKYTNLNTVIIAIDQEMRKDKYPTVFLDATLKDLKSQSAEDEITKAADPESALTPMDKLRAVAKADIELGLYWKIVKQGPRHRIELFRLSGIDSYTLKSAGSAIGSGEWASASEVSESELLREAVLSKMDDFKSQLMEHFNTMFTQGREIKVVVSLKSDLGKTLNSTFGDDTLRNKIQDWITNNAVEHRLGTPIVAVSKKKMTIPEVRIALYNSNNIPQDAELWSRPLVTYLKSLGIVGVNVDTIGLGKIVIELSNTEE